MNVISQVKRGARQHPLKPFILTYLWIAGIYTMLSVVSNFIPLLRPDSTTWQGIVALLSILVLSAVIATYQTAEPAHVRFKLPLIPTTIQISFGDIFQAKGAKVIAVNEYFDSDIPHKVASKSLHGQLIQNHFEGQAQRFEEMVDRALENSCAEEESSKRERAKRYPIGTTAVIEANEQQFFLPALTKTDVLTNKASCDLRLFTVAMARLWEAVRTQVQGEPVNVPLIGSGQAQVDLPSQQLLQLIIMTLVEASKQTRVTDEIRIVLPYAYEREIDLDVIKRNWSERGLS